MAVKRVGVGMASSGLVALGFVFSTGIVSISMNAVGWIAIGMNAAGFVAVGLINSVGVFSFGGVNSCGGYGMGGVNDGHNGIFGVAASVVAAIVVVVYRVRTWPSEPFFETVSLAVARDAEKACAEARLAKVGDEIVVADGATELRVEGSADLAARCAEIGRGKRVIVDLRRVARPVENAGYRDDAAAFVHEIVAIAEDPRRGWLRKTFGDRIGLQLALACVGLGASIVALLVWR